MQLVSCGDAAPGRLQRACSRREVPLSRWGQDSSRWSKAGRRHLLLDANLAKGGWYETRDEDFYDGEHLNHNGATRFSWRLQSAPVRWMPVVSTRLTYSYDQWGPVPASIDINILPSLTSHS